MRASIQPTTPKPFVFVLMPFRPEFDDIYEFGIKGAAKKVGAYAERVDEQLYREGILERIYNQINKADVIVADMTGQNPNVFYEVGYAHALGKIVLLMTKDADDIPFDLKHRPHIVYGGKINKLKNELSRQLKWAIGESKKISTLRIAERYRVSYKKTHIPETSLSKEIPVIDVEGEELEDKNISFLFAAQVTNYSTETLPATSDIYLFTTSECAVKLREDRSSSYMQPSEVSPIEPDDPFVRQFKLNSSLPPLVPGKMEVIRIPFEIPPDKIGSEEFICLRINSDNNLYSFSLKLKILKPQPPKPPEPHDKNRPSTRPPYIQYPK